MQPFRFRLERVLEWQQTVCHLEEQKTRLCRLAIAETEERIAQLKADSLATEHELLRRPTIAATDLKALAEFRLKVVKLGRALAAEKQTRVQALEKQTQKLLEERHRLRLIEKLRERALDEYTRAADRELETVALECHLSKWVSNSLAKTHT
jgi:regulator of replication initiation timing